MRVIGVDPSISSTGYAVVDINGSDFELIEYGRIKLSLTAEFDKREGLRVKYVKLITNNSLGEKVYAIFSAIGQIIKNHGVTHMVVETAFANRNISTMGKLENVRGAIMSIAHSEGVKVYDCHPSTMKRIIGGYGKSSKSMVEQKIRLILKIPKSVVFKTSDESDAIALALCLPDLM